MTQLTSQPQFSPWVDVNVSLSRWPFRRLPLDEPERLADALTKQGVTEAWVGSLDALLHRDLAAVNAATATWCGQFATAGWKAVGCVNPRLPDWQEDLRRCHEVHHMFAIRLHPNYHNYKLDDAECMSLLRAAAERGLLVQIALSMEDERTQHDLLKAPRVDPRGLRKILQEIPSLRIMLLNMTHTLRFESAAAIALPGRVWFDISMLEGVEGVARLVAATSAEAVVYGSLAPLFYQDASRLKLIESGLEESALARITSGNAAAAKSPTLQ